MPSTLHTLTAISLGIFATLAFHSSDAIGYPTSAVSIGSNPVVSVGGTIVGDVTHTLLEADTGADLIVTDVFFSVADSDADCTTSYIATLHLSDGTALGAASSGVGRNDGNGAGYQSFVAMTMSSGLRVPAGDSLHISTNRILASGCDGSPRMNYTVSGYRAQP